MKPDVDRLAALANERADSPAPLDRLSAAVLLNEELHACGEELLDRFVAQARREDCSWTEIGAALGVSKQAAHQRFLPAAPSSAAWPPHASEQVRAAIAAGQDHARQLGHNYLGTEHVLAGLLEQPDGVAAQALTALGVDRDGVVAHAKVIIGVGSEVRRDAVPLAPRLKRALELGRAHSRALGHRCIETEDLLLAFGDIEDCVATRIMADLGAPPDAVREQLATLLRVDPAVLRSRARRRRLRRARSC
jgi:ClpA/ClpB-like protein